MSPTDRIAATPTLTVTSFPMPFRIVFRHTTAAREATENVIVALRDADGTVGYGEGCPRSYVTGETFDGATRFLNEHGPSFVADVSDVNRLRGWIDGHRELIDANPAAFCALELAAIDLFARRERCSVEALLGLPPLTGPFAYSAVLGDSGPLTYGAQLVRYRLGGLRHFKLKLSGDPDRDRTKFRWFRGRLGRFVAQSVRVDANNLWRDPSTASDYLRALDHPLLGIEEPLAADDVEGFAAIAEAVGSPIILDESLLRPEQLATLPGRPEHWILNCRISKSGGLIRSLDLIAAATERGLKVIVGAHVGETSLLTRAALAAASSAGDHLVAQEGAFGTHLLRSDLCNDPIMFGRSGLLGSEELASIGPYGLGVMVDEQRLGQG